MAQVDQANLLAACGKAEVCLCNLPASTAIGNFEAQWAWMFVFSLAHRHVSDESDGCSQPARSTRAALQGPCFQGRSQHNGRAYSLVLSTTEGIEILASSARRMSVTSCPLSQRVGNRLWCSDSSHANFTAVRRIVRGEDFSSSRVIDRHQPKGVVIVGLPKLAGDAEIVEAVAGRKLIATDLVPLFRGFNTRGSQAVDAQPMAEPTALHLLQTASPCR